MTEKCRLDKTSFLHLLKFDLWSTFIVAIFILAAGGGRYWPRSSRRSVTQTHEYQIQPAKSEEWNEQGATLEKKDKHLLPEIKRQYFINYWRFHIVEQLEMKQLRDETISEARWAVGDIWPSSVVWNTLSLHRQSCLLSFPFGWVTRRLNTVASQDDVWHLVQTLVKTGDNKWPVWVSQFQMSHHKMLLWSCGLITNLLPECGNSIRTAHL